MGSGSITMMTLSELSTASRADSTGPACVSSIAKSYPSAIAVIKELTRRSSADLEEVCFEKSTLEGIK